MITYFLKGLDTMDERIKEHLKRLNRYYLQLLDIRKESSEVFKEDDIHKAATERILHLVS